MNDHEWQALTETVRGVAWTLNDTATAVRREANSAGDPERVRFAQSLDYVVESLLELVDPDEVVDEATCTCGHTRDAHVATVPPACLECRVERVFGGDALVDDRHAYEEED